MSRALTRSSRLAVVLALTLLTASLRAPGATAADSSPVAVGSAPMSAAFAAAAATLPPATPYGAFVHFAGGTAESRASLLADHGLAVGADFDSVDVTWATGTLGALLGLRAEPGVVYLEANRKLSYFGDSGPWTTGARAVRTAVGSGPYVDGSGRVIDGAGVGVAVVDSGVDGTHPDLANRLGKAFKVVCSTPGLISTQTEQCFGPVVVQEAPMTDNTGGHGTHVSGIAVGDGTASNGTYQGVAPKATLFSYGVGEAISVLYNAEAFQHMIDNYASFSPRIRVVNNSYGDAAGTAYDPNSVFSKLTRRLVAMGVSVVFAAGNGDTTNNGGTGADDRLSSTAKDPTPGVVAVANYDDGGTANRNGALDPSSSRGKQGDPANYPDISAPGSLIVSTCNPALPVCRLEGVPTLGWAPRYATMSGTSMASPHVAGAIALLYQARPDLTPAQVEDVLQDSAYKFSFGGPYEADPQNPGGTTSFDKGAGLLDVPAALDALDVTATNRPTTTSPSVSITSPGEGETNDGSTPLRVAGQVYDGVPPPATPALQTLSTGDQNDLPAPVPGAADLASLSVLEQPTGLQVTIGVRDLSDVGPLTPSLRLFQNLGGVARTTSLSISTSGVTAVAYSATTNNVVPTSITRDLAKSTITVLLPFTDPDGQAPDTSLGNPSAGALGTNVRILSFIGSAVDQLPGGIGQAGTTAPEYTKPYQVLRPGSAPVPTASVTVAVDGGPEQPATLTGSSPTYGFDTTLATTSLADGAHVVTSRLYLNGALAATDTASFSVARPRVITSGIAVTSPAEGATVPRAVVDVTGTSTTDAPSSAVRSVRLDIVGNGATTSVPALGTASWTAPVDFGALPAGSYVLTARFLLDGVVAASASRTVIVPVPTVLVSCAPQALRFWQDQYGGGGKVAFTQSELDALAAKGAELSNGYFNASGIVSALYVKGKISGQLAAARQYAALLLDLAGGQLSASYSRSVGLSGSEQLNPSTYDTSRLGSTVGTATAWVRAQLPSGDVAGAESVAGSIARGTGLSC